MRLLLALCVLLPSLAQADEPDLGRDLGNAEDSDDAEDANEDELDKPPVDAGSARAEAHALVANRRFCKEGSTWLHPVDRRWCKHIDGERCPGMKKACAVEPEPKPAKESDFNLPHVRGLEAVPWVVAILGLGFLVFAMVRRFAPGSAALDRDTGPEQTMGAEIVHARLVGETDIDRLLRHAESAVAAGNLTLALACLHAALLQVLGRAGLYLDPSKTNGDYVAELRGRPELRADVVRIMALVERAQFGGQLPSPSLFTEALAVVRNLAHRLAQGGVLALLVLAIGCGPRGSSESASGRTAVFAFLKSHGTEIHPRRKSLDTVDKGEDPLLVMADAAITPKQATALVKWVEGGGVVIVAGHSRMISELGIGITDLADLGPDGGAAEAEVLNEDEVDLVLQVPGRRRLKLTVEQVVKGRLSPSIGSMESSYAAWGWPGEGRVLVLADDDLLTDAALVSGDDAAILVWLFGRLPKKLQLIDDLTGVSPPLPPSSLLQAKLLPVFGQLVLVLVLFGLLRGTAFGRRRDPPVAGRRRFVEHVLACAALYARGKVGRYALGLYATLCLEQLRQRLRPRGAALSELAEAIAQRTGRPLGEVMALLVEAQDASRPPTGPPERQDGPLDLLRSLAQLLQQTGGSK